MDLELKGKTAIVTGGSRGIGKATALELAREGAAVALVARDIATLKATAVEISGATGTHVKGFSADTSDDGAVNTMVANVVAEFGGIDILVNCAALPGSSSKVPTYDEITHEQLWQEINLKVMGYLRTARAVVPHMAARGSGRIINISGLAARSTGSIIGSVRNVSVAAMTKNLADELGSLGITAVCVHPGPTRTEQTPDRIARQAKAQNVSCEAIEKKMASRNLLGRMVTSEEIACLVTFLASSRSISINGDAVIAGGGIPGPIYY